MRSETPKFRTYVDDNGRYRSVDILDLKEVKEPNIVRRILFAYYPEGQFPRDIKEIIEKNPNPDDLDFELDRIKSGGSLPHICGNNRPLDRIAQDPDAYDHRSNVRDR